MVVIDPKDPTEVLMWENLFASDGWRKFIRIQKERIDEAKKLAWVTFKDERSADKGRAQIDVLQSIADFEQDLKQTFTLAQGDL